MPVPTQALPAWLSASTSWITTGGAPTPTTYVVPLPETYYGPSIPLDSAWVYGGSTSPPAGAISTVAATSASAASTPLPVSGPATSGASSNPAGIAASSAASASSVAAASASGTTRPTSSLSRSSVSSLSSASVLSSGSTQPGSTPNPTGGLQPGGGVSHHGLSHGAIIALATVFSIFGAFLLFLCLFCLRRRRRRREGADRNGGRALHGDTSVLPAGPDERGSLLAGRRNGGESPEMRERSGTPIADSFISARRRREAEAGGYHAVGAGSMSGSIGQAYATDQPLPPSHSGYDHGSDETRHTASSRAMFDQGTSSTHNIPPSPTSPMLEHDSEEAAELVTAQRATRSPLARLARFSWFAKNRNTAGTSMAATAGTDEEYLAVGRDEPLDSRRHSASAVTGRQVPGEPIMIGRRSGSAAALVSSPSPPPTPYPNRPEAELGGISRRVSGRTNQSDTTDFHTAPSRPLSYFDSQPGPRYSSDQDNDSGPAPTSADFPPIPLGEVPWPRFGGNGQSDNSPETNGSRNSSDPLDLPAPERYKRHSAGSMGKVARAGPSGLAAGWVPDTASKRQSAPDMRLSLEDAPPTGSGAWLRNTAEGPVRSGSNRMTLGPSSFVDTPQFVAQPDVASLHGDTHSHYGSSHSPSGSGHRLRSSISSERHQPSAGTGTATNPPSTLTPFSTTTQAERARLPSLSAIGGMSPMSQTFASDQTASGSGTGSGSGSGGGTLSSGGAPASSEGTRMTSEYGELAPSTSSHAGSPRRAPPMPFHLSRVAEGYEGSGSTYSSTPPPASPTAPKVEPLSPPPEPKKSWWKS